MWADLAYIMCSMRGVRITFTSSIAVFSLSDQRNLMLENSLSGSFGNSIVGSLLSMLVGDYSTKLNVCKHYLFGIKKYLENYVDNTQKVSYTPFKKGGK